MAPEGQELASIFARLTGEAARDPLDTQPLLTALVDGGRRLFGARGASVHHLSAVGRTTRTEGTVRALRGLEDDATGWREGPGHDARTTGCALIDVDLGTPVAHVRWPRWAARATALGHGRVTALPLPAKEGPTGALVLFDARGRRLDERALTLARLFADAAAHTLSLQHEVFESRVLADQLEHALSSRIVVEQAKGIVAARRDVPLDEAFERLRRYARSHRRKVADVARQITEHPNDLPFQ
ncbi:GAF and ANTAR domain-containing protein [Streptomyces sp. NPDC088785]|uniref:GAF and ANTAR domain-containing protein n=1 Tax=Streptomyces sp. NPDC088785 TaxID=3365897 RepID=UPI00382B708C